MHTFVKQTIAPPARNHVFSRNTAYTVGFRCFFRKLAHRARDIDVFAFGGLAASHPIKAPRFDVLICTRFAVFCRRLGVRPKRFMILLVLGPGFLWGPAM
jgi:hypothetical protein